jgi:hypothetical protein
MLTPAETKTWQAALRSGNYEQTTEVMVDIAGRYCALGVLALLLGRIESLDLSDKLPNKIFAQIADLNDNGFTFAQIADYIDAVLLTPSQQPVAV